MYELKDIGDLKPDPVNPRTITDDAASGLRYSIESFGDLSGITWNKRTGELVCGHQRVNQLKALGGEFVAKQGAVVVADGERFPVQVVDWPRGKQRAANVAANNRHLAGEFDRLEIVLPEIEAYTSPEDFKALRFDALGDEFGKLSPADVVEDEVPDVPKVAVTKPGDVWTLGRHTVVCGDSVTAQFGDVDLMLTDPPYCSGGFQEAGKKAGSIGTRGAEMIHNDQLSTRGYQSLMKEVISSVAPKAVAAFTDWRMWIALYDVAEACGYGVRSMVVWDKMTPGMGRGFRNQHELLLVSSRVSQPFNPKKAQGNVIQCKRTGNKLHATEKPVELLAKVLEVFDIAKTVADPFLGSGTTLIAAEQLSRTCYGVEISPQYCDVVVERWENLTGGKATRNG